MGGFILTLIGVMVYCLGIGAIRYFSSKKTEVYFDCFDAAIIIFYVIFHEKWEVWQYAVALFAFCLLILVISLIWKKPFGDIFFERKYYFYKKGERW